MTIGEDRVRIKFNPSANDTVSTMKRKTAELIDMCADMQLHASPEVKRLLSLAMTHYETAAMYAVKGATSE
jgi:hypothetical protein